MWSEDRVERDEIHTICCTLNRLLFNANLTADELMNMMLRASGRERVVCVFC